MKTKEQIEIRIKEIEEIYGHVLNGSTATIPINAPRALEQISAETKLQTLHWVLATKFKSKLKGYN